MLADPRRDSAKRQPGGRSSERTTTAGHATSICRGDLTIPMCEPKFNLVPNRPKVMQIECRLWPLSQWNYSKIALKHPTESWPRSASKAHKKHSAIDPTVYIQCGENQAQIHRLSKYFTGGARRNCVHGWIELSGTPWARRSTGR